VGLGLAAALAPDESRACTTFRLPAGDQWVFGKNLDWSFDEGMLIVNKRGVAKASYTGESAARWVSRYGSVTCNQYGRELPMGGINEAGLVIENMWLNGARYPAADARPTVGELQWIQYQLDTAASLEEVIASDAEVRISERGTSPLHFLVCDRTGACAAIEFLGGAVVVHRGADLPATVLTNNTYEDSQAFRERVAGDTTGAVFAEGGWSLKRFVLAARAVTAYDPGRDGAPVPYAFEILETVSHAGEGGTQWRIVYEPSVPRIHFRTRSHPAVKTVDLRELDYACDTPVLILDMAREAGGDATAAFTEYTREANYALVRTAYQKTDFLQSAPDERIRQLAAYPEMMPCQAAGASGEPR
jgi:choloylglycine hydrolase